MRSMIALLAAAVALPLAGQDFNWSGRLAAGATLEVRGVNGRIEARLASGSEARVTADKTARDDDPAEVRIVTVPHDGGMLICAVYPDNDPEDVCRVDGGGHHRVRNNDVNVNFTVEVPAGVVFEARTVNGDVAAEGLRSTVDAHTVNGEVRVSTTGMAEASTVNGSVRVRMGRTDWTGEAEFETVNGGITLEVTGDLNTRFEAETVNGDIESDFPVMVRGRFGPRRATGTIGDGGSRLLSLKTVNGSIVLRRT